MFANQLGTLRILGESRFRPFAMYENLVDRAYIVNGRKINKTKKLKGRSKTRKEIKKPGVQKVAEN